ncbi:MAG: DedA family protein [Deltaproteobacteria bacterium]|nr:DedA family protein [Deltaproteobacteria bacterium]MBW2137426.1 DedA family protein [Deltaproteobacteria bacterium]
MKGYIDHVLTLIGTLPDILAYSLLALSAFLENVFPPIPGDTITAFGAFLVGTGKLGILGVYVSTTLGSVGGFMGLFLVGKHLGRPYFMGRDHRFFKTEDMVRAEEWFSRYGYFVIAANRFLPGLRSVISVAGGLSGLKTRWVALLAFLSSAVWNLIWILAGYTLGSNWDSIRANLFKIQMKYNIGIFITLALVIIFVLFWKRSRKKKGRI